jgi:hypothetical protein
MQLVNFGKIIVLSVLVEFLVACSSSGEITGASASAQSTPVAVEAASLAPTLVDAQAFYAQAAADVAALIEAQATGVFPFHVDAQTFYAQAKADVAALIEAQAIGAFPFSGNTRQ